jgi:homocysteine S-methyltransferase
MPDFPLATALAVGTVVLDGGLATQLEAQGHDLSSALWSARLLHDDPEAVVAAHAAFAAAGAQVATTASYQVSVEGLAAAGLDAAEARRLVVRSVHLAERGAPEAWIAGSVGPYGAALADGSEYTGDYADEVGVDRLRQWHRPRMQWLAEAGADVLACETVPAAAEAEAYAMARELDAVVAVGVNCTDPDGVLPAVLAARAAGKPVVVYPNSGEGWDAAARRWTGSAGLSPADALTWVQAGARLVGGCCRVGPDAIAALTRALRPVRSDEEVASDNGR